MANRQPNTAFAAPSAIWADTSQKHNMDLKEAKLKLEKIRTLLESLERDESNISSIERDLMLSYIRGLYDVVLSGADRAPKQEAIAPPSPKAAQKSQPARPQYTPPRIIEIPDSLKDLDTKPAPPPQAPPRPTPPVAAAPVRPAPQPEAPALKTNSPLAIPPKVAQLFAVREASDLSEKLSERPIQDLTKALAINDRLLYMNELFGRDLNALNDTLSQLNRLHTMEEAKALLEPIAARFDWPGEEREDTARDFIKLVRRRYA